MDIPANTLKAILSLRSENGLNATKEALETDLTDAKVKWTLEETPRYRRAGRSPIYISGKYLTKFGVCPATGEADAKIPKITKSRKGVSVGHGKPASYVSGVDETEFYKALHSLGFDVKMRKDLLTGELETIVPASISKLDLNFSAPSHHISGIHITQTPSQMQVTLTLDKFLELAGLKP